jgi:Flp pilus assembly protein protease CpaA
MQYAHRILRQYPPLEFHLTQGALPALQNLHRHSLPPGGASCRCHECLCLSIFRSHNNWARLFYPGHGAHHSDIIDIDHRIIPDKITLPGIPVFFLLSLFLPDFSIVDSLLGILAGGGSLYLVAWGYHLITGQEGMGGGDIKLLAMIGAVVGWQGILFTIFAGSFLGCAVGIALMIKDRKGMKLAVPFGPFLSLGAVIYLFYGQPLINWYFIFLQ